MSSLRQNIDIKNTLQNNVYITPQMKQSLAILQMPLQELSQEVSAILEENPVLEIADDDNGDDFTDESEQSPADDETKQESDIAETISGDDWEEYIGYEAADDISYRPMNDEGEVDFEQFVGSSVSLYEHLINQLHTQSFNEEQIRIGEYIIGNLSDDGYFRTDTSSACEDLDVSEDDFEAVLAAVKTFDPAGIASHSLCECIITQMLYNGCEEVYAQLAEQILDEYSAELSSFKYDEIIKGIGIERDTFDYVLSLMKKTDPKPGLNFSGSETSFITPDVFIVRNGGGFDIILNESGIPSIRLNNYYTRMMKDTSLDTESRQYIKEKIKNAVWVIESLQKRQKAIYKVVKAITEFQGDFLKYGSSKLKALRLKDIAEVAGLHESTVSRVTSGKYAMTDHGVIELKAFFAKSAVSDEGDMSTNTVKSKIKELIDSESVDDPLSDQRIVELIGEKGIKVARRTVAKYRDEMNIPTMSQRKRLKG